MFVSITDRGTLVNLDQCVKINTFENRLMFHLVNTREISFDFQTSNAANAALKEIKEALYRGDNAISI